MGQICFLYLLYLETEACKGDSLTEEFICGWVNMVALNRTGQAYSPIAQICSDIDLLVLW